MLGVPLLCVNTTHLAAAYDVLLPEKLAKYNAVHTGLQLALKKPYEKYFASIYNDSDGLVVLSEGLRTYWRERGVTAPIHVISRAVKPEVFDRNLGQDPYTFLNAQGPRLLCAGRHTREKEQDRAIRIFARHILPHTPGATLTLLGIGPDTDYYKRVAKQEGVESSVHFPGEVPFTSMPDYYAYADLFVHTSRSETYGNVLGEALWCGTPTVAFADGMGVSAQVQDNINGLLLGSTSQDGAQADAAFGAAVVKLIGDEALRGRLGKMAAKLARERSSPLAVEHKIADAFKSAQDHAQRAGLRPSATGPRALRWLTTFSHFRRWAFFNGALVAIGHMRRPHAATSAEHPQIHG
jgi:1,2-diacylglycerol 3-alpha-glucosyltransferase